uniref:C2H2-type domain-containing protein n=1 Tax=Timema bartmani TaxID=61472 RepID=A0A7R9EU38_9NEOP|nr:unnamed protein product [Timema bartmani]
MWEESNAQRGVKCFFCDECSLSFKFCTSLQKHKVNRHEKEQGTFLCEQCDCVFTKKIQLTNHKIQAHQVERKFLCQVCGKKLSNSNSLNTHLDTHSEMRKFSCSFCNKTFRQKEKLKYHTRTHTGERPHLCLTCGKSFIRKSRLDDHILRHQGKKRYRCSHCSKSYAGAWDLKQHVKKQHPTVEEMSLTKPEPKKTPGSGAGRADDDCNNPDDPVAIIDEEDEADEDVGSHSEEECADRQPEIITIPHISVDLKQTENQLASLPLLSQVVVQSGTNAAENNEILLHLNPVTSVIQNSTPSSLNQPKILLHLDSLQLHNPSLYLHKNSNDFGSKFLLQLNNSSEQQNQSFVGTLNNSDSNSRILIHLDPRHSQSESLSASDGSSTNGNSRILLQLNPVTQQSQTQDISTNTILTLADTIHLVDDVNLGGLMTQYIQLTPAQTEPTRTGDLPVIQLPTQGSSAATYQLQEQPGQIFTVSGFEVPTITL